MKIDKKLLMIFLRHSLPMLLALGLLGISSAAITVSSIQESTRDEANRILYQVITYYDSVMDEINAENVMLLKNPDILANLKQVHDVSQMDYQLFRETQLVKSFLASSANTRATISSIFLYIDNGSDYILYSGSGYEKLEEVGEKEWVTSYMEKPYISNSMESERHGYNIIRLSRPILDRDKQKTGVIIVDVRISELTDFFENYSGNIQPAVVVYNEQDQELFSYAKAPIEENNPFTIEMSSSKYGWKYSLSFSRKQLYAPSYAIIRSTCLAMIIAACVGFAVTYKANEEERRFISNLISALNKAGSDVEEPEEEGNIFSTLDDLILKHFLEQDYLKIKAEAQEYRALQLQINPHFLFNSLNNMYWKSIKMSGGENDLSQMIKLLSSLMKFSLRFDNLKGIPLKEEMEAVNTYINLQQFRFKDSFSFHTDIPDGIMDTPVPAMIFQPILENAFNHGFGEEGILNIFFSASLDDCYLTFEIKNDGNPFPEAILHGIKDKNAKALKSSSSLGLLNTRDRIDLFYNHQSEMILENKDGMAIVIIRIAREVYDDAEERS